MKYLKLYENYNNIFEEIHEFSKLNLAFLLDEGYKIYCQDSSDVHIIFLKENDRFAWNDVVDHIIPFIEILQEKYGVYDNIELDIVNLSGSIKPTLCTVNEILSDDDVLSLKGKILSSIEITVITDYLNYLDEKIN